MYSYYECRTSDIAAEDETFDVFSYGAFRAKNRTHHLPSFIGLPGIMWPLLWRNQSEAQSGQHAHIHKHSLVGQGINRSYS